jgi:hypothetical protein
MGIAHAEPIQLCKAETTCTGISRMSSELGTLWPPAMNTVLAVIALALLATVNLVRLSTHNQPSTTEVL